MAVILNYPMTCKPAPYFEGDEVGPALLELWNRMSGYIPNLQIQIHGQEGIVPSLRLLKCKFMPETGAVKITVRPASVGLCPCYDKVMHFVPGAIGPNGGSKLIKSMTVGYPEYNCTTKITNTALDSKGAIIKEAKAS